MVFDIDKNPLTPGCSNDSFAAKIRLSERAVSRGRLKGTYQMMRRLSVALLVSALASVNLYAQSVSQITGKRLTYAELIGKDSTPTQVIA